MPKKDATKNLFADRWRIVSMSAWDEEEEGDFEFDPIQYS